MFLFNSLRILLSHKFILINCYDIIVFNAGFSLSESESQKQMMQSKLSVLEELAYQLAGHPFSLTSVDDIGQVLYGELRLPVNGETESSAVRPSRTLGTRRTANSRYD